MMLAVLPVVFSLRFRSKTVQTSFALYLRCGLRCRPCIFRFSPGCRVGTAQPGAAVYVITPSHGHFDVAVCSPGELNPRWIVVFVTRDGQPFSVVRVMDAFNPELITHTLDLIECLDAGGYSFASIISTLSQEGAQ